MDELKIKQEIIRLMNELAQEYNKVDTNERPYNQSATFIKQVFNIMQK